MYSEGLEVWFMYKSFYLTCGPRTCSYDLNMIVNSFGHELLFVFLEKRVDIERRREEGRE